MGFIDQDRSEVVCYSAFFEIPLGQGLNHGYRQGSDVLLSPSQHSRFNTQPGFGPFDCLFQ